MREIYCGVEYFENFGGTYSRIWEFSTKDTFENVVKLMNGFTKVGRFLLPKYFVGKDDKIKVVFEHYLEENFSECFDRLTDEELEYYVEQILNTAYEIEQLDETEVPSFGVYSFDNVLVLGAELLFIPPVTRENIPEEWKKERTVIAPEVLKTGSAHKKSSTYVFGKILEFIDKDRKYYNVWSLMIKDNPDERQILYSPKHYEVISEYFENIERESNIYSLIEQSEKNVFVVNVYGERGSGKEFFSKNIFKNLKKAGFKTFQISSSLTNLSRQMVLLDEFEKFEYKDELLKCLYSDCKYNTVVGYIISFISKIDKVVILFDNSFMRNSLVRAFYNEIMRSRFVNNKLVLIILSSEKLFDCDLYIEMKPLTENQINSILIKEIGEISFSKEVLEVFFKTRGNKLRTVLKNIRFSKNIGEIFDEEKRKFVIQESYFQFLGEEFSIFEVKFLDGIYRDTKEILYKLKELTFKGILVFDGSNFSFANRGLYKFFYESIQPDERIKIHFELARKYMESGSLQLLLPKVIWHLEESGQYRKSVILLLQILKQDLEEHKYSPVVILDIFDTVRKINEKYLKKELYTFYSLYYKFLYQSGKEDKYKDTLPNKKYCIFVQALKNFVNGDHTENVKFLKELKVLKIYKDYWLYYLGNFSYFELNNDFYNSDFYDVALKLREDLQKFRDLKAEMLLLHAYKYVYSNKSVAKKSIEKANEISKNKVLRIKVYNLLGLLNDGTRLSSLYFQKAIEIAKELGYFERMVTPWLNNLRALLYFGDIDKFKKEIKSVETVSNLFSLETLALTHRIFGMYYSYEQNFEEGMKYLSKALEIEEQTKSQRNSLRAIILHYALCGKIEEAKKLSEKWKDDSALKTRAFEYFTELLLSRDDKELLENWVQYRNSEYELLREEIFYLFAEKLSVLDPENFRIQLDKYENLYALSQTNLSLFYTLLAKAKYYLFTGKPTKAVFTYSKALRLLKKMNMRHPILKFEDNIIANAEKHNELLMKYDFQVKVLDTINSLSPINDPKKVLELVTNIITAEFNIVSFYISVQDRISKYDFTLSLTNSVPEKDFVTFEPFAFRMSDYLDKNSQYIIYVSTVDNLTEEDGKKIIDTIDFALKSILRNSILNYRSMYDTLTKVYTRQTIIGLLEEKFENWKNNKKEFYVMMLDIDDFKSVNDTYGHKVGDELLYEIAQLLKNISDKYNGTVGRYGGEEFTIICDKDAIKLAEEIRKEIESSLLTSQKLSKTISIGVAHCSERKTVSDLLGLADQRLYVAKNSGKNRLVAGQG